MLKSTVKYMCAVLIVLMGSGTVALGEWEFQESGVTQELWDVCFIDEYTGWAVGGTSILKTNDGGETWVHKILDFENIGLTKCMFIDKNIGFCCDLLHVISTVDGGENWTLIKEYKHGEEKYKIFDMCFVSEHTGWIVGRGHLTKTDDGGETWTVQQSAGYRSFASVDFLDELTGWAVNSAHNSPNDSSDIYFTNNGGDSWEKISMLPLVRKKLMVLAPDTLWALGTSGYGSLSVDGGKTWSEDIKPIPSDSLSPIKRAHDIHPLSVDRVFALYWYYTVDDSTYDNTSPRNALWYTSDRGASFTTLLEYSFPLWHSIYAVNEYTAWCVGDNGIIVKYSSSDVSVHQNKPVSSEIVSLHQNTPNPFNNTTMIRFTLLIPSSVELRIININGQVSSVVRLGYLGPGYHSYQWNGGCDGEANTIGTGIYVYQVRAGNFVTSKKMLMIR